MRRGTAGVETGNRGDPMTHAPRRWSLLHHGPKSKPPRKARAATQSQPLTLFCAGWDQAAVRTMLDNNGAAKAEARAKAD